MTNNLAITLLVIVQLLVSAMAWRNSRTEEQNAAVFAHTGELKTQKYLVVLFLVMALFGSSMALIARHSERAGDGTWPMALFGVAGTVFVWLRSFFSVRLDVDRIRFGWRLRRNIAYTDIAGLQRRSNGRDAEYKLMLRSGASVSLGSSMPCETLFIEALQKRTGCTVSYWRFGKETPEPENLVLQARYEKFKAGLRK